MNGLEKLNSVPTGDLYDANFDKEIIQVRNDAKYKCWEYNNTSPKEEEKRQEMIRNLLGSTGKTFYFEPPFYCDYGTNIHIGTNFYSNHNLIILDGAEVRIGENVFIAPNVGLYTAGHPLDAERRAIGLEYALPITIEDNVWIGGGVTIVGKVTIGKGSVIGAGSVVIRDIPEGVVAAGNPCKVIRRITEEDAKRENFLRN